MSEERPDPTDEPTSEPPSEPSGEPDAGSAGEWAEPIGPPRVDEPERAEVTGHDESGLDLARQLTRSAASGPGGPRRPKSSGSPRPKRAPRERSGRDDRDPHPLAGEVSKLIDRQGWELSLRMRGVFARWEELVGEEVSSHTTPESFVDGKLMVRTDSTAWATQLRLLAPTILRRLNEELGHGTVALIEVLGPDGPSWTKGRRSVRDGRGPRDTYG